MKKFLLCATLLLSTCLNVSCKAPPPRFSANSQPTIRIGIVEEKAQVNFRLDGPVDIRKKNGSIAARAIRTGEWRVSIVNGSPARLEYRLSVGVRKDRRSAEKIVKFMNNRHLLASIRKYDLTSRNSLRYLHRSVFQVLLDKKFQTEDEAKAYAGTLGKQTHPDVVRVPISKPRGTLRFTHLDDHTTLEFAPPVRLTSHKIELAGVEVGRGFHWESSEHRSYSGTLEFLIDETGQIAVVNELPVEDYLKGVIPSEMPASFPFEALKAQAVAARDEAFTRMGMQHPGAPFDLCDDVHCQVYSGLSRQAQATNKAVDETRGIFALYDNEIIEAFYSAMSGGHTENNENVWNMEPKPYLRGILDNKGRKLRTPLTKERNVKKWIDGSPDVYSNVTRGKVPKALKYGKKYFRWQVQYSRQELEQIIRKKTGEQFGHLKDLRPVRRGVSGRLIELEIVGTRKKIVIGKELAIRQALSKSTLYSSCFYTKKKGKSGGLPKTFILKGAGWGHGVGMCQIGAAMRAHSGQKFDAILKHYYRGIYLKKLYD